MSIIVTQQLPLTIRRMDVEEDGGNNPIKLAKAIHSQIKDQYDVSKPVPIEAIAKALEIIEIRREPLTNFEGALVTTANRQDGSILVNSDSRPERQRFTIAHELGHYLNLWHVQTADHGFECSTAQMKAGGFDNRNSLSRDARQEMEANRFAIELLLPNHLVEPALDVEPNIKTIKDLVNIYACSFEATARRICELSFHPIAIVFSKDGCNRYWVTSSSMPKLNLMKGNRLPLSKSIQKQMHEQQSSFDEADPDTWLHVPVSGTLHVEHRPQSKGHAITLLQLVKDSASNQNDEEDEEDNGGIDDAYQRYSQFQDR